MSRPEATVAKKADNMKKNETQDSAAFLSITVYYYTKQCQSMLKKEYKFKLVVSNRS